MRASLDVEFRTRFDAPPEVVARAPGRVNLIGEHTDYNEGLVLPCAVDRFTWVLLRRRHDDTVRIYSRELGAEARFDSGAAEPCGDWVDYAKGVFSALRQRGFTPGGFDVGVGSEIPLAAGLSSSAAFTLGLVTALDRCLALGLDARARCDVAHEAETDFVGVPCGIMDPYAVGLGRRGAALRIDCRSREVTPVPWPRAPLRLLVAHSGVQRSLAGGGLAERRSECGDALVAARAAGVASEDATALRDLGPGHLSDLRRTLTPLAFRRVRHVICENLRVDAACAALTVGDFVAVGALLREGMQSLRDDFDVSTPEVDLLCDLADALPGVYGSRLTGAGFGGCTLHLVEPDAADAVIQALATGFEAQFGRRPPILALGPADGAEIVA